jgi:hypothetical protein
MPIVFGGELGEKPFFEVRLETPISSLKSVTGSDVRATVVSPAIVDGQVYLPAGTKVNGKVIRGVKVGLGLRRERAQIEIKFFEAEYADERRFLISALLVSIDNAREEVNELGQVKGILAADTLSSYVFGIWNRPTAGLPHRALLGLTGAGGKAMGSYAPSPAGAAAFIGLRYVLVRWPNPEIHMPAGTELRLRLESIADSAPVVAEAEVPTLDDELGRSLEALPFEVGKPGGGEAGDIINLAFVGSKEEIITAFESAGWQQADRLSPRTFHRAYQAYNRREGYPTAPVSDVRYQGAVPDFVFQKSFNTIVKRHHIRIWAAEGVKGEAVWVGAASHDIGIEFERSKMTFTHKIDERLDVERAKVINDLSHVGCVEGLSYVNRPAVAKQMDGKKTESDGRLAVVLIGTCASHALEGLEPFSSGLRPGFFYRLAQRTVLEARNYLVRRNAYFQSYKFIRKSKIVPRLAGKHGAPAKGPSVPGTAAMLATVR